MTTTTRPSDITVRLLLNVEGFSEAIGKAVRAISRFTQAIAPHMAEIRKFERRQEVAERHRRQAMRHRDQRAARRLRRQASA